MKINTTFIIDDDPIFVFGSKVLLKKCGFASNIVVFQNGKEALETIVKLLESEAELPEVIFLDLNMPIMDGWEFLEAFGKLSGLENIRLYILSSSIDSRDMERAKDYDIVADFIAKPLTEGRISELLSSIEV
ncbi:response regulator [Arenibacter aquaticus]|uniref:Response regulator n=1 Tax=Arenibacter aquaticus TaxID=2489054 RepID=A0A430K7W1_9FLAO|nr:response regulator [Arenibacter aquaticus]RTE55176.1 response regulator [Arenibacter aquaticus]